MEKFKKIFKREPIEKKPVVVVDPQQERPVWNNTVRYIALVSLIIILLFGVYLLRGSITLIALAALTAYLLAPLVRFQTETLHIKRGLAITLAYVFLVILLVVLVMIVTPRLTQAISNFFAMDWPQVLSAVESYIKTLAENLDNASVTIGGFTLDLSKPLEGVLEWLRTVRSESINIESLIPDISATLRQVFSISTNVFGQIITGLIMTVTTIMASVYFCRDGGKIPGVIVNMFEEKYKPEIRELLHRLQLVLESYFFGELRLMFFVGLITFLVYFALGIRWALLLGVIAGFCEVVPNIGPILATVPAIISSLIFGSRWLPLNNVVIAIIAVIMAVIIQQTENIFLVPHIMGNALELHPVVIMIGIITLSSRMGLLGAVFAAPMIALVKEILYFIIRKINKQDPYPELYSENS